MRADFLDPTVVHRHDLVGGKDGGEAMCNRNYGFARRESLQRELDLFF